MLGDFFEDCNNKGNPSKDFLVIFLCDSSRILEIVTLNFL